MRRCKAVFMWCTRAFFWFGVLSLLSQCNVFSRTSVVEHMFRMSIACTILFVFLTKSRALMTDTLWQTGQDEFPDIVIDNVTGRPQVIYRKIELVDWLGLDSGCSLLGYLALHRAWFYVYSPAVEV